MHTYICLYMYIYTYIHTYIYIYVYVYVYVYIYIHIYIYILNASLFQIGALAVWDYASAASHTLPVCVSSFCIHEHVDLATQLLHSFFVSRRVGCVGLRLCCLAYSSRHEFGRI